MTQNIVKIADLPEFIHIEIPLKFAQEQVFIEVEGTKRRITPEERLIVILAYAKRQRDLEIQVEDISKLLNITYADAEQKLQPLLDCGYFAKGV